jgi:hypothetical protein
MLSHHRALRFAAGETAAVAFAQAPHPALSVKKVKDNLYVVQGGGGGNSSIIVGQNASSSTRRRPCEPVRAWSMKSASSPTSRSRP